MIRQNCVRSGAAWRSLCGWLVLASVALVMPACAAADGAAKKADPEKMFKRKDTNNDGSLSLDEFKAGGKDKEKAAKNADKRFKKADANADGKVTLEEFKAATTAKE